MNKQMLIRALRWGGLALAVTLVGYLLSIGPVFVLLMEAGPNHGLFEVRTGFNVWQVLYEVPAMSTPEPARTLVTGAMNSYVDHCLWAYRHVAGQARPPDPR